MKKGGDQSKNYACPDDGSPWEFRVKKRERFGSSPEHCISTLKISHADVCMEIAKLSDRQI